MTCYLTIYLVIPATTNKKRTTQKIQEIKKALTTKRKGSRMASGGYKMDVENLYASGSFVKVNRRVLNGTCGKLVLVGYHQYQGSNFLMNTIILSLEKAKDKELEVYEIHSLVGSAGPETPLQWQGPGSSFIYSTKFSGKVGIRRVDGGVTPFVLPQQLRNYLGKL